MRKKRRNGIKKNEKVGKKLKREEARRKNAKGTKKGRGEAGRRKDKLWDRFCCRLCFYCFRLLYLDRNYFLHMKKLGKFNGLSLRIRATSFIILISLYFGFVLNYPVVEKIIGLAKETGTGYFAYTSPLLLSATFAIIFSFITLPYITKPFFIILTFTSALASYATLKYGVIFDSSMIENIFDTHSSEALSYVNLSSVLYGLFFGVFPD